MAVDQGQIDTITRFISNREKQLDGRQPDWKKTDRGDFQAIWSIIEVDLRIRSHLRFRVHPDHIDYPSISLIFAGNNISRIDLVSEDTCEPNPIAAARLGLPAIVCGPHVHGWNDNKDFVLQSGSWELPVRAPIGDQLRTIEKMFLWFCNEVGINMTKDHRRFVEPPRDLLSGV